MSKEPRLLGLVVALALGCAASPVDVDGSVIVCSDSAQCLEEMKCDPNLNRCVSSVSTDAVAPQLVEGSVVISTNRANQSTPVLISFSVDEELGGRPEIRFIDLQGIREPIFNPDVSIVREDRLSYIFRFDPSIGNDEIEWTVVTTLIDRAGNANPNVQLGGLTLDFTAPSLVGAAELSRNAATAGVQVEVSFSTTEDLEALPQAFFQWPTAGLVRSLIDGEQNPAERRYQFTYSPAGDEPEDEPQLVIQMQDTAGNESALERDVDLRFDFNPPAIESATEIPLELPTDSIADRAIHVSYGSTWRIQIVATEPLGRNPRVFLDRESGLPNGLSIDLSTEGPAGALYTYELVLDPQVSYPQGAYDIWVELEDLAGNTAREKLAGIAPVIDTLPPRSPSVGLPDVVSYVRSPWGRNASDGRPQFILSGAPGAVEECDPNLPVPEGGPCGGILVLATETVEFEEILGRSEAAADGGFETFELTLVDAPELWVAAVDAAGNISDADGDASNGLQAVAVRDITWVATLGGKISGSTVENPHRLVSTPDFRPTLTQDSVRSIEPELEDTIGARLGLEDGLSVTAESDRVWTQRFPTAVKPPARTEHATAFDSERGRTVLFGGLDEDGQLQDVWEWDGIRWEQTIVEGESPLPRSGHAMAFDAARGSTLVFGGLKIDGTLSSETWIWNGTSWTEVTPEDPSLSPPPRRFHDMVYFPERGSVVLFGGLSTSELDDVWEWNGESWSEIQGGLPPPARWFHSMAYDPTQGLIYVYGGRATTPRADMWAWDGTTWFEEEFLGERPSPLAVNRMTYDTDRGRMVLFGDGLWEWDGIRWTEHRPNIRPRDRSFGGVEYDPVRRRVVLFSGRSLLDDCETAPVECTGDSDCATGAECDPDRFVCHDTAREALCQDVWEWSGTSWAELTPGDASIPEPRDKHAMAFDERNLRTVVFGGSNGPVHPGTWTWGGANWLDQTPVGAEPPRRIRHGMVWNPIAERIVIMSGIKGSDNCDGTFNTCGDMWSWDGDAWEQMNTPGTQPSPTPGFGQFFGPPPRHSQATAFITAPDFQGILIFGGSLGQGQGATPPYCPLFPDTGSIDCGDTWHYQAGRSPNEWEYVVGASNFQPTARTRHAMAYDESRNAVVLFGGLDATEQCEGEDGSTARTCGDTWEWGKWGLGAELCTADGAYCWRRVSPAISPPPRSSHSMAYDKERKRIVLHGGQFSDGGEANDTWEWNGVRWIDVTSKILNPPARFAQAMAYDTARNAVVMFGGSARRDTWELSANPEQRPALISTIDWRFASAPVSSVQSIEIVAQAEGTGFATGTTGGGIDGASMLVWRPKRNGWVEVGSTADGVETLSAALEYREQDPGESQSTFTEDDLIYVAIEPTFPLGSGLTPATVSLDYFELSVKYRL